MNIAYMRWLCGYNAWANARYFERLESLQPELLQQPVISSFPSLLSTMAHLVVAEWSWLERWRGVSPSEAPAWFRQPELRALRKALSAVERERSQFLDGLNAEQLAAKINYQLLSGLRAEAQLCVLIQHVINHSTFHRGQLATMLRQLGATAPGSDLDDFPQAAPL